MKQKRMKLLNYSINKLYCENIRDYKLRLKHTYMALFKQYIKNKKFLNKIKRKNKYIKFIYKIDIIIKKIIKRILYSKYLRWKSIINKLKLEENNNKLKQIHLSYLSVIMKKKLCHIFLYKLKKNYQSKTIAITDIKTKQILGCYKLFYTLTKYSNKSMFYTIDRWKNYVNNMNNRNINIINKLIIINKIYKKQINNIKRFYYKKWNRRVKVMNDISFEKETTLETKGKKILNLVNKLKYKLLFSSFMTLYKNTINQNRKEYGCIILKEILIRKIQYKKFNSFSLWREYNKNINLEEQKLKEGFNKFEKVYKSASLRKMTRCFNNLQKNTINNKDKYNEVILNSFIKRNNKNKMINVWMKWRNSVIKENMIKIYLKRLNSIISKSICRIYFKKLINNNKSIDDDESQDYNLKLHKEYELKKCNNIINKYNAINICKAYYKLLFNQSKKNKERNMSILLHIINLILKEKEKINKYSVFIKLITYKKIQPEDKKSFKLQQLNTILNRNKKIAINKAFRKWYNQTHEIEYIENRNKFKKYSLLYINEILQNNKLKMYFAFNKLRLYNNEYNITAALYKINNIATKHINSNLLKSFYKWKILCNFNKESINTINNKNEITNINNNISIDSQYFQTKFNRFNEILNYHQIMKKIKALYNWKQYIKYCHYYETLISVRIEHVNQIKSIQKTQMLLLCIILKYMTNIKMYIAMNKLKTYCYKKKNYCMEKINNDLNKYKLINNMNINKINRIEEKNLLKSVFNSFRINLSQHYKEKYNKTKSFILYNIISKKILKTKLIYFRHWNIVSLKQTERIKSLKNILNKYRLNTKYEENVFFQRLKLITIRDLIQSLETIYNKTIDISINIPNTITSSISLSAISNKLKENENQIDILYNQIKSLKEIVIKKAKAEKQVEELLETQSNNSLEDDI